MSADNDTPRRATHCTCRIGNSGRGTYRQQNDACPLHGRHGSSGLGHAGRGGAVEAERREDQPEPCNTAAPTMTAGDEYPALRALAEMLPDRAGGEQAAAALAAIDALRDRRDEVMRRSGVEAQRLRGLLDDALEIIWNLVEADSSYPCQFDHHGNCQAHGSSGEPGQCIVAYGAEFVTNRFARRRLTS